MATFGNNLELRLQATGEPQVQASLARLQQGLHETSHSAGKLQFGFAHVASSLGLITDGAFGATHAMAGLVTALTSAGAGLASLGIASAGIGIAQAMKLLEARANEATAKGDLRESNIRLRVELQKDIELLSTQMSAFQLLNTGFGSRLVGAATTLDPVKQSERLRALAKDVSAQLEKIFLQEKEFETKKKLFDLAIKAEEVQRASIEENIDNQYKLNLSLYDERKLVEDRLKLFEGAEKARLIETTTLIAEELSTKERLIAIDQKRADLEKKFNAIRQEPRERQINAQTDRENEASKGSVSDQLGHANLTMQQEFGTSLMVYAGCLPSR